jgi:hypothetical protein
MELFTAPKTKPADFLVMLERLKVYIQQESIMPVSKTPEKKTHEKKKKKSKEEKVKPEKPVRITADVIAYAGIVIGEMASKTRENLVDSLTDLIKSCIVYFIAMHKNAQFGSFTSKMIEDCGIAMKDGDFEDFNDRKYMNFIKVLDPEISNMVADDIKSKLTMLPEGKHTVVVAEIVASLINKIASVFEVIGTILGLALRHLTDLDSKGMLTRFFAGHIRMMACAASDHTAFCVIYPLNEVMSKFNFPKSNTIKIDLGDRFYPYQFVGFFSDGVSSLDVKKSPIRDQIKKALKDFELGFEINCELVIEQSRSADRIIQVERYEEKEVEETALKVSPPPPVLVTQVEGHLVVEDKEEIEVLETRPLDLSVHNTETGSENHNLPLMYFDVNVLFLDPLGSKQVIDKAYKKTKKSPNKRQVLIENKPRLNFDKFPINYGFPSARSCLVAYGNQKQVDVKVEGELEFNDWLSLRQWNFGGGVRYGVCLEMPESEEYDIGGGVAILVEKSDKYKEKGDKYKEMIFMDSMLLISRNKNRKTTYSTYFQRAFSDFLHKYASSRTCRMDANLFDNPDMNINAFLEPLLDIPVDISDGRLKYVKDNEYSFMLRDSFNRFMKKAVESEISWTKGGLSSYMTNLEKPKDVDSQHPGYMKIYSCVGYELAKRGLGTDSYERKELENYTSKEILKQELKHALKGNVSEESIKSLFGPMSEDVLHALVSKPLLGAPWSYNEYMREVLKDEKTRAVLEGVKWYMIWYLYVLDAFVGHMGEFIRQFERRIVIQACIDETVAELKRTRDINSVKSQVDQEKKRSTGDTVSLNTEKSQKKVNVYSLDSYKGELRINIERRISELKSTIKVLEFDDLLLPCLDVESMKVYQSFLDKYVKALSKYNSDILFGTDVVKSKK